MTILAGATLLFGSCTKNFDSINQNKNKIPTVGPAELPFLFSHAEQVGCINSGNYQVAQNLFADQYAQYFACEATYFPSDRYTIRMDWVGANFNPIYTEVYPALQSIFQSTDSISAEHAMAEVMWVYSFLKVTDYWGPIPYSGIGGTGSIPYDSQESVYTDFFTRLDQAATVLSGFTGTNAYGSYDLIYQGDVDKWIKFTNTLRLRLALRISKVDAAKAKTEAEAAVAAGVMTTSSTDDAFIEKSTTGGDVNGLSIMSDWNEFRMSSTMASVLKGYQDPRISEYFVPTANSLVATPGIFANYKGLRNGLSITEQGYDGNLAADNSHQGPRWSSTSVKVGSTVVGLASYSTTPQNVIETAEAFFLRAEGALNGWDMGGTAKDLYESGIKQSFAQWGVTDATTISNYIASSNTPIAPGDANASAAVSNIPIKFNEGDATMAIKQIATQKWLALFPDGEEAWADYRRLHVMPLYPVVHSDNPDLTDPTTQWIRRIPFLESEKNNNATAVQAAVGLLGGDDKITTPLWWDKN